MDKEDRKILGEIDEIDQEIGEMKNIVSDLHRQRNELMEKYIKKQKEEKT